ncbi:MAG: ATP-grasp domain-containing protein [Bacteroidales bacterium]|nr:ATP-grasp domain-containing protein [Bacteroidales bacterium]
MKKFNILVFPCGSEIALDIHSSVKYSTYFHLIGGSSVSDHGMYVYEDYIPDIPYVTDSNFISTLKTIIAERKIDAVYPAMDIAITMLKEHEEELGCKVISSPVDTTQISLSKDLTYKKLADTILIPKIYDPLEIPISAFPVFAKPKIGYSAKGTKKLNNQREVNAFIAENDDILILEYLPGEEYTVDCFTDRHRNLLFCGARKRNRVSNGISVNTFFSENQEEFVKLARLINEKIHFRGAWFFQVKRNVNGQLCLLEIASRLGGSSLLSRAKGVNFALLSLFDAFDHDVSVFTNDYDIILDRALECKYKLNVSFESVYCDYDDCLVLNGYKLNTLLVQFLYQCVNENKKVYLLTKHTGTDLNEELKKFRIYSLFDKIIHIDNLANKADYIKEKDSIFIDDSHAERLNIKERLNIPVFAPEMVDALLK